MTESDSPVPGVMGLVRTVLRFEMTIAEWIGTALIAMTPYLVIGLIWAFTHTAELAGAHGISWLLLFVRSILAWPVLLGQNLCVP